ncbi:MAG: hypothetical protein V3W32_05800 [Gemmatimonadota bacterium]
MASKGVTDHVFHQKLAIHLGGHFARLIGPRLAEIVAAVEGQQRQASFSVTAEIKPIGKAANPDGDLYKISLKPRLRTPDEAVEINLQMVDGQLSLYVKDETTEAVRKAASPGASGNGAGDPDPAEPGDSGADAESTSPPAE